MDFEENSMNNRSVSAGIIIIIGLLLLSSCARTKFTDIWKDSTYQGPHLKNILVIGIADQYDQRLLFENTFVSRFEERGATAMSIASVSGKKEVTIDDSRAGARQLGCDAIFAVRLIGITEEELTRVIYPATNMSNPEDEYLPQLFVEPQRYNMIITHYVMESSLYETAAGRLIWRARSDTVNPHSMTDNVERVAKAVMRNLHNRKLIY
jgi:hypothetical protein